MKICIKPHDSSDNKYISIIKECLKNAGNEIVENDKIRRLIDKSDIFYFNWVENLKNENLLKCLLSLIQKIVMVNIIKLKNKKIIWVMHNKVSHETISYKLSLFSTKYFAKKSDKIIIHSHESKEVLKNLLDEKYNDDKIFYLPHPHYINVYKKNEDNLRKKLRIEEDDLVYCFIGQIRPYKNIDILIDSFNDTCMSNTKLIIAGKPYSEEYKEEIISKINGNKNIISIFEFIKDDELVNLINTSNVVVLPYDKKSSLNSGSVFLAFSNKKTILIPTIGTVRDFEDQDMLFSYDFEDIKEHKIEITRKFNQINKIYQENPQVIKIMGEKAYNYVKQNNNHDYISQRLNKLIDSL